jgi:hypothetical protein
MSLRKDRQISQSPKNTFAGQLVCPHCQTAFAVTWRRYWSAPWGNYRCPKCRLTSYATADLWWAPTIIFLAMVLIGIVSALFVAHIFHNAWIGVLFVFMSYFIGFPLDKWIDGHLRHLKIH